MKPPSTPTIINYFPPLPVACAALPVQRCLCSVACAALPVACAALPDTRYPTPDTRSQNLGLSPFSDKLGITLLLSC
ncbi:MULTISPECIES: hypothetical protein [Planktothricoides]|uniref:Secreted protein n=1 Tax=Planktothricoides raciborskii GIHE-MW2 TaxID=2792601 RepID=A0AAU8JCE8_9CYAN|nr:hypothetical protein [Planktothricoides sp. SR001]